jgi:hypothetical protein
MDAESPSSSNAAPVEVSEQTYSLRDTAVPPLRAGVARAPLVFWVTPLDAAGGCVTPLPFVEDLVTFDLAFFFAEVMICDVRWLVSVVGSH